MYQPSSNGVVRLGAIGRRFAGALATGGFLAFTTLCGVVWNQHLHTHRMEVELARLQAQAAAGGRFTAADGLKVVEAMLNRRDRLTTEGFTDRDVQKLEELAESLRHRGTAWARTGPP